MLKLLGLLLLLKLVRQDLLWCRLLSLLSRVVGLWSFQVIAALGEQLGHLERLLCLLLLILRQVEELLLLLLNWLVIVGQAGAGRLLKVCFLHLHVGVRFLG